VDEGSSFNITLNTTGVQRGQVIPYTISGVSSADVGGASLTGNFTINNNQSVLTFNVTADQATEGTETFGLTLNDTQDAIYININDTSVALNNWIFTASDASYSGGAYDIAADTSDNIYYVGNVGSASGSNGFLYKLSQAGSVAWSKIVSGNGNDYLVSVAVDSSGNVFAGGWSSSSGTNGGDDALLIKYDSSGTRQWSRSFGAGGLDRIWGVAVDTSGNPYVFGYTTDMSGTPGAQDVIVAKYDTSGTVQWARSLGANGNSDHGYKGYVDASGNAYVIGSVGNQAVTTYGNYDILVAKYNSAGTLQWQKRIGNASYNWGNGITADASGNVYIAGYTDSGSGYDIVAIKLDSTGSLVWHRFLTATGTSNDVGNGVVVDGSGNVYVTGYNATNGTDIQIVKYNSSGVLQWQRGVKSANNAAIDGSYGIALLSTGDLVISGAFEASLAGQKYAVLRLPADGSKTGTYGDYTIVATTLTDTAGNFSATSTSLSSNTITPTTSNVSTSDSSSAMTTALIVL